jgi:hypothetical protein
MKEKNITHPFYTQIQKEINRVEKKANTYTWLFYTIRISQILFGGTITVLSGIALNENTHTTCILILGAITTAITAIDTLFQVDAKKNTYKLVLFELRSIRSDMVFHLIKENKIDEIVLEALYEKYRRANSYARDLIGSDNENESKEKL